MAARLLDWGQESKAGPRQLGALGQWLCTNLSGRFQYFQTRYRLTGALLANHQHGAGEKQWTCSLTACLFPMNGTAPQSPANSH